MSWSWLIMLQILAVKTYSMHRKPDGIFCSVPVNDRLKYWLAGTYDMYLHVLSVMLLCFLIGWLRIDCFLCIPFVELVVFFESSIPPILNKWKEKREEAYTFSKDSIRTQLKYLSVNPVSVEDEWMNLMLAQAWQTYEPWLQSFVASNIEFYASQLGVKVVSTQFGSQPIQIRRVTGRPKNNLLGVSKKTMSADDWCHELDIDVKLLTKDMNLTVSVWGVPISMKNLEISGNLRLELEWIELDARDASYDYPSFPNVCGLKMFFTNIPSLAFSLWIADLLDVMAIPLLRMAFEKLVINKLICSDLKLGPTDMSSEKMAIIGDLQKALSLKERNRRREMEYDLSTRIDESFSLLSVTVQSGHDLEGVESASGEGSLMCIVEYGDRDSLNDSVPPNHKNVAYLSRRPMQQGWKCDDEQTYEFLVKSLEDTMRITVIEQSTNKAVGTCVIQMSTLQKELGLTPNAQVKYKSCPLKGQRNGRIFLRIKLNLLAPKQDLPIEDGLELQSLAFPLNVNGKSHGSTCDVEGGFLRIRILKVQNMVSQRKKNSMKHHLFVRYAAGSLSEFGDLMDQRQRNDSVSFFCCKEHLSSNDMKSLVWSDTSVQKGALETRWPQGETHFESNLTANTKATMLCVMVLEQGGMLHRDLMAGSVCVQLGSLQAVRRGVLFQRVYRDMPLLDKHGESVTGPHGTLTTIDFVCEFLPNYIYKD